MTDLEATRLETLYEEVERVWEAEADLAAVGEVIERYPDHSQELKAFFAYLLQDTYGATQHPERMAESEARTRELLEQFATPGETAEVGSADANAQATPAPGGTFLALLHGRTGLRASAIAKKLGLTISFLKGLALCGDVPLSAATALAERALGAFSEVRLQRDELISVVLRPGGSLEFASAKSARTREALCYTDIVERSGLPEEEVAFWRALSEDT